ncbi:hypothetical protein [Acidicapsa ligni]|uniref:hypothetical protein n=1 Tax=Acidicapsa ligni TaxID=542300 RepID=UPI0021E0DE76|nr:hypothetical protein [Acidicapsa ligni]
MARCLAIPLTRIFTRTLIRTLIRPHAYMGLICVAVCMIASSCGQSAWSQVLTVSTKSQSPIDRRYAQIEPTHVDLPQQEIDARGHQEILRLLTAEQGFAMRPLPRGKKGLTLVANGKLSPAGEGYLTLVGEQGVSVKPGDRVVLSNISIDRDKMVFEINGGPDHKHAFLRHIQIGMDPNMTHPVVQDEEQEPTGSRITLSFNGRMPDVTPAQVMALLAPLISFEVKSPEKAYTDTLPPKLKEAILNHHVMVGMSTQMVLYALGQPESKSREIEGQMPFEEWIYGHPPQDVNFVRVNGNRVIRVEVARLGQPLEIFTKDEVQGQMMTDGRPVLAETAVPDQRTVSLGDAHRNPDTQAPLAPPSLRKPGEKLPEDDPKNANSVGREGPMKPVMFPKDTTHDPARVDQARPDPAKPDQSKPDQGKPDQAQSATPSPADAVKPDAAKPDTGKPDTASPDATPEPSTPSPAPPNAEPFLQNALPARP